MRRVTAEGNLRAVKATPLTAPPSAATSAADEDRVARRGRHAVKAGEVVVRFDPTEPEKQLRDGQADLDGGDAKLAEEQIKSKTAVADRDSDGELAGAELEQQRKFQTKDKEIFSRNQIIESEIDEKLAGAKQQHAEKTKADRAQARAVEGGR